MGLVSVSKQEERNLLGTLQVGYVKQAPYHVVIPFGRTFRLGFGAFECVILFSEYVEHFYDLKRNYCNIWVNQLIIFNRPNLKI
jgi:hypothetical protein